MGHLCHVCWEGQGQGQGCQGQSQRQGCQGWIGVMGLIGGVVPWGRTTLAGSGRWDWFMGARDIGWIWAMGLIHGGVPWGRATLAGSRQWVWLMGARDTGWTGAMGSIYGDVPNDKVIWLLNLNEDTMCPHVWRWGKCAECVWLRGW